MSIMPSKEVLILLIAKHFNISMEFPIQLEQKGSQATENWPEI